MASSSRNEAPATRRRRLELLYARRNYLANALANLDCYEKLGRKPMQRATQIRPIPMEKRKAG